MQARLAAGTTLKATVSLPDYPAGSGWVLHYRLALRSGSGAAIDLVCTASGDDHLLSIAYATTAAWPAGAYTVNAWVTNGTERHVVDSECGELVVTADPSAFGAGVDQRSQAEIALAAVKSMLAGKASYGVEMYRIAGRELRSYTMADMIKLEAKLRGEVNAEYIAAGKPAPYPAAGPRRILTRFA